MIRRVMERADIIPAATINITTRIRIFRAWNISLWKVATALLSMASY